MFNINTIKLLTLSFIVLIASSCSDPSSSDGDEDHADVDGLELLINDVVVYKEFDGAYYIEGTVSEVSPVISMEVNETLDITVHFLGPNGNEIEHEEEEEEEELNFTITDDGIISIEMEAHDDHEDEEHCEDFLTSVECNDHAECEWHSDEMACEDADSGDHDHEDEEHHELVFELTGIASGSTDFKISLAHGDHSDYVSKLISVTVE